MTPDRDKTSHKTRRLQGPLPLIAPLLLLLTVYAPLFVWGKPENHNDYAAWLLGSIAQIVALWLLARQYLDSLLYASKGYDKHETRLADLEEIHRDELLELHRKRLTHHR